MTTVANNYAGTKRGFNTDVCIGANIKSRHNMLPPFFMGCDREFSDSRIVIFGAPFDGTSTLRPGSRFAPTEIRAGSWGLETYSPLLDRSIEEKGICDLGDIELPVGNTQKSLKMIEKLTEDILTAGKKPFVIGGEHLVTLPVVSAFLNRPEYKGLSIIHFDAHTDLRENYMEESLSHATVIRKIWEKTGDGRIWQYGIRSGTKEEFNWSEEGHTKLYKFNLDNIADAVKEIGSRPVYLTMDLDVLDPSLLRGTGTPEAGGVTYKELENALLAVKDLELVGADMVELSPHYDNTGVSTFVACKIMREILLIL